MQSDTRNQSDTNHAADVVYYSTDGSGSDLAPAGLLLRGAFYPWQHSQISAGIDVPSHFNLFQMGLVIPQVHGCC